MAQPVNPSLVSTWQRAVEAADDGRLNEASKLFWEIRHFSAKIWFNLATVHLLQGDLTAASEKLTECVERDEYLAVAYFQNGVILCQQGSLAKAREMFGGALKGLRDTDNICYRQLGLDLCLTLEQVQHNQSVVDSYLSANRPTAQIPVGELKTLPVCLFRPSRSLVKNIEKKKFLPTSKVISAVPEFLLNKDSEVVRRAQSSSAPTSPSSHRKLEPNPPTQSALTPPPSRPPPHPTPTSPPSRPPPRLPPSAPPPSGSSRRHDDGIRQEGGSKGRDQQSRVIAQSRSAGKVRVGSPGMQTSSGQGGLSQRRNLSHVAAKSDGCLCEDSRTVSRSGKAVSTASLSSSPSAPAGKHPGNFKTGVTSDAAQSVQDRIKDLDGRMSGGQGCGKVKAAVLAASSCRHAGERVEVRGEGSWSESGMKGAGGKPKPPRPPPPKFVS